MIEELYKECLIFNYQAKNISSEKVPATERRSVTSRYHGTKISGTGSFSNGGNDNGNDNGKKSNRFILTEQLCTCITIICTFLSRRCRSET